MDKRAEARAKDLLDDLLDKAKDTFDYMDASDQVQCILETLTPLMLSGDLGSLDPIYRMMLVLRGRVEALEQRTPFVVYGTDFPHASKCEPRQSEFEDLVLKLDRYDLSFEDFLAQLDSDETVRFFAEECEDYEYAKLKRKQRREKRPTDYQLAGLIEQLDLKDISFTKLTDAIAFDRFQFVEREFAEDEPAADDVE